MIKPRVSGFNRTCRLTISASLKKASRETATVSPAAAVTTAPNPKTAQRRSAELLQAAREASDLTNKLLSFERASGTDVSASGSRIDLNVLIANTVSAFEQNHPERNLKVTPDLPGESLFVQADQTMLQEAMLNIFSNSLVHGGPGLRQIWVKLRKSGAATAEIVIQDDGVGIPEDRHIEALSRFSQAGGGPGSGLGLAIATRVLKNHGGQLSILPSARGAAIKLSLPLPAHSPATRSGVIVAFWTWVSTFSHDSAGHIFVAFLCPIATLLRHLFQMPRSSLLKRPAK